MADLTDNWFYPSAERICLEQRWKVDRQKMPILAKKKSSFQMKLILLLAGMQTSKIVAFGAQKIRTHTLKSRRTQNESLCGADFDPEAELGHFSS